MVDLQDEVDKLWPELAVELERVLRSARFIMGPDVAELEAELASYLQVEHAVAVNSGTDALIIALQALGIGPGDEVITTPFTFVATGSSILRVGATPVFCDIDADDFNLSVDSTKRALTDRTKAIMPVHLFGHAADMPAFEALATEHDLVLIEDVAQALSGSIGGRKLASIGAAGALSFFPSKNLGAFGDGGMIVFADDEPAQKARMLRTHGARRKYFNEILGHNSRLDSVQAAILRVKLRRLEESTHGRRRVASFYSRALDGIANVRAPLVRDGVEHAFHQYTVRVPADQRDAIRERMSAAGVASMVYYPKILTDLPLFADYESKFPNARRAAEEVLSLPIWPDMSESQQTRVIEALTSA